MTFNHTDRDGQCLRCKKMVLFERAEVCGPLLCAKYDYNEHGDLFPCTRQAGHPGQCIDVSGISFGSSEAYL